MNPAIFDHKRVALHKARAAAQFSAHDFLFREAAERVAERLEELRPQTGRVLDLSGHGLVGERISGAQVTAQALDANEMLAVTPDTFDVAISAGGLHWVNDLPGVLIQIRHALKKGGLFIAVMPGPATLKELRAALEQAEITVTGGVSPRISPFIEVREAAGLLQRAGFAEPVADSEIIDVEYDSPKKLLHDLRGMGETNAQIQSVKHFTRRAVMEEMAKRYRDQFTAPSGRIQARVELVTMTGWK